MQRFSRALRGVVSLAVLAVLTPAVPASDPPDSEVNPVTGKIESVCSTLGQSGYYVRHTVDPGQGGPLQSTTIDTADDDLGPRIAISSVGDTGVTWSSDATTDAVYYRWHDRQAGEWSSILTLSEETEGSRDPEIVHDGTDYWIVFEFDRSGGGTGFGVKGLRDDSDPYSSRVVVGYTGYTGDRDSLIQYSSGHLWVSWVHSSSQVGWSEYDYGEDTWGDPGYESYASDSVEDARGRIRTAVTE